MRRFLTLVCSSLLLLVLVGSATLAWAFGTTLWRVDTAAQLEQGELDQVMVSSLGEVKLGRSTTRVALSDVALVWSVAEAADGTLYLGTGNNGQVLRLRGTKVDEVLRTKGLVVSALAFGEADELFAGTLPDGKIYRIEGPGGKAKSKVFVELEKADHIWALQYDRRRKVLFAATGPEGILYAIDRSGRAEVFYDSTDDHFLSLLLERDGGDLLAGTSPGALLLRVSGPGRAVALHDFDATEVKGIAKAGDQLYLAVNKFPAPPAPPKTGSLKGTKAKSTTRSRPKPGKGKIFHRRADGSVEPLAEFTKGHLTGIEAPGDGLVYAGTGAKGRVIAVDDERVVYTVVDVEERQVLALSLGGKSPAIVTGDAGAVYRLGKAAAGVAEYRTAPLDAGFISQWGNLEWAGSGKLLVQTRSGNTKEPNQTWSDWSAALDSSGRRIKSPSARYLQLKVRWSRDAKAVLRALSVYHLRTNQRPVVTKVEVASAFEIVRPGTKTKSTRGSKGKSKATKRRTPSSRYKITWKVDNPDDDPLRYRLYFREEEASVWRTILPEEEVLTKTTYQWDTTSVPAGFYQVKVEASDEVGNPAGRALRHSKLAPPIVIDNQPPTFPQLEARGRRVTGRVVDGFSPIGRIEYSLDGRAWVPVFPLDALLDSREESFAFDLPAALPAGPYTIALRAFDRAHNQTTGRLLLTLR